MIQHLQVSVAELKVLKFFTHNAKIKSAAPQPWQPSKNRKILPGSQQLPNTDTLLVPVSGKLKGSGPSQKIT
jgi:hypothetical protein